MSRTDGAGLLRYMRAVTALSVPVVALSASQVLGRLPELLTPRALLIVTLLSLVLVAGEMWPIPVARGEEAGDEITVSSTFGFALLLVAPVFLTIAAQTLALAIDWKVRGRQWHRLPFNIAQYALAFVGARAVYAVCADLPFDPQSVGGVPHLGASLLAGVAFLLVNNTLVGIAVALSVRMRLRNVLVDDLTWQVMTSAPLLALGPLTAQAADWTPTAVLLLLLPIAALHRSGRLAMRREHEALRDGLTGLPNRTMLTSVAERSLESSLGTTAMLLIDLDHFKDINDTLGHGVGDQVLVAVADRLREVVGEGDLVARLGGDEFVVLTRLLEDGQDPLELAHRLCAALSRPYDLHDVTLTVGCSVGIGLAPEHADTVPGLLRCADVALYDAKVARGEARVYERAGDQHSIALLGLQADLRAALEPGSDQLWVAYQPQLDLATGRVDSVECLARWSHPDLGLLMPEKFVPLAESTSLVDQLLRRVLELTLQQLVDWEGQGLRLRACVNVSARQLSDLALPETVGGLLARFGVAADRVTLEVTESRLMADPERSAGIVRRLHSMGLGISVDDFGTGYSSLSYLHRLSVDELKIDKSFVGELGRSGNPTIIRSTIELGHNLGLRVVAEGIEDLEQAELLAKMGCDALQGYHVGRPVPAEKLPALVESVTGRAAQPHPPPARRLGLVSAGLQSDPLPASRAVHGCP